MEKIEKELMFTAERFKELYELDIHAFVEEKGGLSYLSWGHAWRILKEQDPTATFEFIENAAGGYEFQAGKGWLVKTKVTAFGMTLPMALTCMDNRNNSKTVIDGRDVTDTLVRCLVKNISLYGIGLPLYVGEDTSKFIKKTEIDEIRDEILGYLNTHKTNKVFGDTYKEVMKVLGIPSKIEDIDKMRTFKDRIIDVMRSEKLI